MVLLCPFLGNILKQRDSTLDSSTRATHKELDGQIQELDKPFKVAGKQALYPGEFGDPSEDCNCRCCLLQRAKWAISKEEYITKFNGDTNQLVTIKSDSYAKFEEEYRQVVSNGLYSSDDGGIIKENEMSPRKTGTEKTSVDWSAVQSEEYSSKFKMLSSDEKVSSAIETRAKWALYNRDGVKTEEIYAINMKTGKEVCRITNQHFDSAIMRTSDFTKKLNLADMSGDEILLLHNHPLGLPPSISDINALMGNDNVIGITVGHDGSIYKYTRPKAEISEDDYNIIIKHYNKYSEQTAIEQTLIALSDEYGFEFSIL